MRQTDDVKPVEPIDPTLDEAPKPEKPDPDEIGLHFHGDPENRYRYGVPPRDLTKDEVKELPPAVLYDITQPGPDGTPLYSRKKKSD